MGYLLNEQCGQDPGGGTRQVRLLLWTGEAGWPCGAIARALCLVAGPSGWRGNQGQLSCSCGHNIKVAPATEY